jgi:hypothetical protein
MQNFKENEYNYQIHNYEKIQKHLSIWEPNGSTILTRRFVEYIVKYHGRMVAWPRDFKLIYKATRDGDNKVAY